MSVGCLQNLYGSVDELKEGKADKETVQIEVDEVCEHGCDIVQQSSATSVYVHVLYTGSCKLRNTYIVCVLCVTQCRRQTGQHWSQRRADTGWSPRLRNLIARYARPSLSWLLRTSSSKATWRGSPTTLRPNWTGTRWRHCETTLVRLQLSTNCVCTYVALFKFVCYLYAERKLKDAKQPIIHQTVEPEGDDAAGFKK